MTLKHVHVRRQRFGTATRTALRGCHARPRCTFHARSRALIAGSFAIVSSIASSPVHGPRPPAFPRASLDLGTVACAGVGDRRVFCVGGAVFAPFEREHTHQSPVAEERQSHPNPAKSSNDYQGGEIDRQHVALLPFSEVGSRSQSRRNLFGQLALHDVLPRPTAGVCASVRGKTFPVNSADTRRSVGWWGIPDAR
jgi:hypothetical protein